MDILDVIIVLLVGCAAGFFNTIAGGGSLLSLPILIFLGLPSNIANATNRVAIFSQNIFAVAGFKSKGVSEFKYGLWLGLSASVGSIIGAIGATRVDPKLFNKIYAVIMVMVLIMTLLKVNRKTGVALIEKMGRNNQIQAMISFFFIGIYGGFAQAGVGFIIIAALTNINGFSLVKTNAVKVFVVLIYTVFALAIFIWNDQINWIYGGVLAVGNSTGAWVASRWSVKKNDKFLGKILIIAVIALAIKLWLY